MLFISPSLPPQIAHLKLRTFYYAGAAFTAVMNSTHTSLTRINPPETLNDTYAGQKMPFVVGLPNNSTGQAAYSIGLNETVVVPNRLYWQRQTYAGNVLQCLPITTSDAYVAGQLPASANDGAAATSWQPATNESASILIDTTGIPPRRVSGLHFDFGTRPVANAQVRFYNGTGSSAGTVLVVEDLGPTAAAQGPATVVPVVDNTTDVVLDAAQDVWTGDWVLLTVEGCAGCDASAGPVGGTIAEFVVY